jgi:hypothetical protein
MRPSLSERATDALRLMESGEEFVYERGRGHIGYRSIKSARLVLMELIHAMAIRRVEMRGTAAEYYRIAPKMVTK